VAIAQTGGDHFFTADALHGQAVSELALVAQRQQQHVSFGVGIEDDVASRHQLSKFGHAARFRELDPIKPRAARKQAKKLGGVRTLALSGMLTGQA